MKRLPLLILVILLIAGLLRVSFIFYVAYVLAALYLYSRWQVPRSITKLHISRAFAPNAFLGEEVPITLTVENQSRLPLTWLRLREMTPLQLRSGTDLNTAVALGGMDSAEFHYTARAMRRGYYRIGPLKLESGDIFGFQNIEATFPAQYLTVYPHIVPIEQLRLPSRLPFGTLVSNQRLYADPARPIGVREYRAGDSLRHINWKVSARSQAGAGGGLMVKTLEPAISLQAFILLDLNDDNYERRGLHDRVEWAITAASSLAAHCSERRQAVGLVTNGFDPLGGDAVNFDEGTGRILANSADSPTQHGNTIPVRTGHPHLMNILQLLARVESCPSQPLFQFIAHATLKLGWGTTIFILTPNGDITTTAALHRLVRAGYNPVLLLTQPTAKFPAIRARALQLGFRAYAVYEEVDLELT